ncbi:GNAT family N-acetyltransferase [Microvirga makkahensis]|uniref:GNAT family N-acetyltransferase n=1 Tax=Microvirga makkahensis TaxID=1128670 RepID=A0A7X3MWB0_9HYPH|nr:GNAT family N-acetyltransferase [Microvirga makkahensis]MXQ14218.1 GNAT family N-acetyltransferase [Microvirga makkahensis]
MQDHLRLDSFDLSLSDIASVDVKMLHALSLGVGWPHRTEDWDMLRHTGQGLAAIDGIGRVFGTAMWFAHGTEFATIGMVITSHRFQAHGNGRWLMEQVLERCGHRNLLLNATRPAYNLYVSLGFVPEESVYQCQGEVAPRLRSFEPVKGELKGVAHADLDSIAALDARAFGTERKRLLRILARDAKGYGIWRDGTLVAYAFRRSFGRGQVVGPIVASNDEDAIALVSRHLSEIPGQFARVDTRQREGIFLSVLQDSGLRIFDTVTTMSKGRRFLKAKSGEPSIFGLASHALS